MNRFYRLLNFFFSIIVLAACSDNDAAEQQEERFDKIKSGIWTNCLDYTDSTEYGIMMNVAGRNVSFTLFDFTSDNRAFSEGQFTYNAGNNTGTLDIPNNVTNCGKVNFKLLSNNVMECIPENYPEDTIHFMYISENSNDWWTIHDTPAIADEGEGPLREFDFQTDIIPSKLKTRGALSVFIDVIDIIGFFADMGFEIHDIISGIQDDKKSQENFNTIMNNINKTQSLCYRMDDKLFEIQNQVRDISTNMTNSFNKLSEELQNMKKDLTTELDEIKRNQEEIKNNQERYHEIETRLIMIGNQQNAVNMQKNEIAVISELLNKRDNIAHTLTSHTGNYMKKTADILQDQSDTSRIQKIHDTLQPWINELSGIDKAFDLINNFIFMLYNTHFENKLGYPYIYDQFVFNLKAWEHQGYDNRNILRSADIDVVVQNSFLLMTYLETIIAENGPETEKAQRYLKEITQSYALFTKTYNNTKVVERNDLRVCQIAGAHFITDKKIYAIDKNNHPWIKPQSPWNMNTYVFGFRNEPKVSQSKMLTKMEAQLILDYYSNSTSRTLIRILQNECQYEFADPADNKYNSYDKQLLLGETPKSEKSGTYTFDENTYPLLFLKVACSDFDRKTLKTDTYQCIVVTPSGLLFKTMPYNNIQYKYIYIDNRYN